MDVDYYRLAYNTFHRNWQRFGIDEKDIPFAKTDEVDYLNSIIPGFSNMVVFFQMTARRDLKILIDNCDRVHNLIDFCTRFEIAMKEIIPERYVLDLSRDTLNEDLPEDSVVEDLPEVPAKEDQSENTMETDISEDNTEEDVSECSKKDSLAEDLKVEDNKIKPEEIPHLIALTLAVSTELILYQPEDTKKYIKNILDIWMKYFEENLKELCVEAGGMLDHLKSFSESEQLTDNFLNKFISENIDNYDDVLERLSECMGTNYADESSEGNESPDEVKCFSKGLCFTRMKVRFRAILEKCKRAKDPSVEEIPLLDDSSPSL